MEILNFKERYKANYIYFTSTYYNILLILEILITDYYYDEYITMYRHYRQCWWRCDVSGVYIRPGLADWWDRRVSHTQCYLCVGGVAYVSRWEPDSGGILFWERWSMIRRHLLYGGRPAGWYQELDTMCIWGIYERWDAQKIFIYYIL